MLRKLIVILSTYSLLVPFSHANEKIEYPSAVKLNLFRWFSITKDIEPIGPILGHQNGEEYTKVIFTRLIKKAHELAYDYYEEGNDQNYTYYSFLVAALTVPLHESRINHFREAYGKDCNDSINQLNHKGLSESIVKRFHSKYRDEYGHYGVLFPNCRYFDKDDNIIQVAGSNDFSDYGIMQLNNRFHEHTTYPEYLFNLYASIDYGLNYLFSGKTPSRSGTGGFRYIRANVNKRYQECNFSTSPYPKGRDSIYYSLIRASWDRYNQGGMDVEEVCRFKLHPKSGHVVNFKRTLDSIVLTENSVYHKYLKPGTVERAALDEIVQNFKSAFIHKKEVNSNLRSILENKTLDNHQEVSFKTVNTIIPTHVTKNYETKVYAHAYPLDTHICGTIDERSEVEISLKNGFMSTIYNQKLNKFDLYVQVRLPHQASFINNKTIQNFIKVKRKDLTVNVRSTPSYDKENPDQNLVFELDDPQVTGHLVMSKGDWGFYQFSDGKKGWIFKKTTRLKFFKEEILADKICNELDNRFYINLDDLDIIESSLEYDKDKVAIGVVTASSLKVRGAASLNGDDTLKRVFLNDNVKVSDVMTDDKDITWYKIDSLTEEKFSGWISAKYVDLKFTFNKNR